MDIWSDVLFFDFVDVSFVVAACFAWVFLFVAKVRVDTVACSHFCDNNDLFVMKQIILLLEILAEIMEAEMISKYRTCIYVPTSL